MLDMRWRRTTATAASLTGESVDIYGRGEQIGTRAQVGIRITVKKLAAAQRRGKKSVNGFASLSVFSQLPAACFLLVFSLSAAWLLLGHTVTLYPVLTLVRPWMTPINTNGTEMGGGG